jgi:NADP-dependent aldehyde dehydrogenase
MSGQTQGYDPRTGQAVGAPVPDSDPAAIEAALADAHAARYAVADSSAQQRIGWLDAISEALAAHADALVDLADAETALGRPRLTSELGRTRAQLALFAEVLRDGGYQDVNADSPDSLPPGGPAVDLRRTLHPVGPVAVWTASNFPFAFGVPGGDTVSALAAGCPVLVKSHPSQPGTSAALAAVVTGALRSAGAPEGAFRVLHGQPAGDALIEDPRVEAAAFTGSLQGGRALFDRASARPRPIPFFGELGSLNPAFVTPAAVAARADAIADGFVTSISQGTGQFCTKPGVLVVPRASGLTERIAARVTASGAGPLLNERIFQAYQRLSTELVAAAGDGARHWQAPATDAASGYWAQPTVLAVSAADFHERFDALTEECFGPFSVLVEYDSVEELPALAARFTGSLTGTLHAEPADDQLASELIAVLRTRVGRIVWNGWPTGVAVGYAMQHGGPYPASTAPATTSVGARAIGRFLRPTAYQDVPAHLLPEPLRAITTPIR